MTGVLAEAAVDQEVEVEAADIVVDAVEVTGEDDKGVEVMTMKGKRIQIISPMRFLRTYHQSTRR